LRCVAARLDDAECCSCCSLLRRSWACRAMTIAVRWLLHAAALCGGIDALSLLV
jgi:hypothetical protein